MRRSNRKSHRRVHLALVGLALVAIASCAKDPTKPPKAQSKLCEAGETLVCTFRGGQPQKCWCKDDEALREILDPQNF